MNQEKVSKLKPTKNEKSPKIDTFFSKLPDNYLVKLYKYNGTKREFIKNYMNEYPEDEEIREKFGHGKFVLYCYKVSESDGGRELYDSAETTLADLGTVSPVSKSVNDNTSIKEEEILTRMALYKELFSNNNNNSSSDISGLVQIMTLQMQANQQNSEQQLKQIQQLVNIQMQHMEQTQNMLLQQKSEKRDFSEFMEAIDLYESIKGSSKNNDDSGGIVSALIKNPDNLTNLIQMFSSPQMTQGQDSGIGDIKKEQKITGNFSPDFVEKVTHDTRDEMSKKLFDLNKDKITMEQSNALIDQIIKEKGL